MKTYPYQDGDRRIQLVEKRELDQLIERLADARESHLHASARDVQMIQRQSVMLERVANDLRTLFRHGHTDDCQMLNRANAPCDCGIDDAEATISAYESTNPEPVANPIDEANARLIAAAPDLLEALECIASATCKKWQMPYADFKEQFMPWACNIALATLAKAKGEQP